MFLKLSRLLFAFAVLATLPGVATAQYLLVPILLDGQLNPDGMGTVDNVTKPNALTGQVVFEGDDDGTALGEEFIYVNGTILVRDGLAIAGTGTTLGVIDAFSTFRHANAAGQVVYTGNLTSPTDDVLMRDATMLLRDTEPAAGIPGRVYNLFSFPSISDAGDIFLEVDLDGATTDDEVLYTIPAGGAPEPLAMNVGTIFREGSLIVGGPLDGEAWDTTAFDGTTCNALGTVLVDGNLDDVGSTTTANDDVLVRKKMGMDYELLLRAGGMLMAPLTGASAFASISDHAIADQNDNWALYGFLQTVAPVTTASDMVIVAGIAGAAAEVLAQEGQDISAITGIPGTTFGGFTGVCVNSNGKVIFTNTVLDDGVNLPPYDEAIFLWDAGTITFVTGDNVTILNAPGYTVTDINGLAMVINDEDRIIFEVTTTGTGNDGIVEAVIPLVQPVEGLACAVAPSGTQAEATWTLPGGPAYDGIRVYEDGVLAATLAGNATSHVSAVATMPASIILIEVEPFIGVDSAPALGCTVGVVTGNQFLLIGADVFPNPTGTGSKDGVTLHDPVTGEFLTPFILEVGALDLYVPTTVIVGPRTPGGDSVVYIADQTGIDNGSIVRYELDGTFIGQFVDDTLFDDVRSAQFQGDTLYFGSAASDTIVSWDIGTLVGTPFITGVDVTDFLILDDGRVLVSQWANDTITLFDAAGLNPVVLVNNLNSTIADPNQIAPLANGNFIVGTEGVGSDEIIEFTLAGTVVNSYPIGFNVQGVYELPNGDILFTTDDGSGVYVLDPSTGMFVNIYDNGSADFYYIEYVSIGPKPPTEAFVRGNCNGLDSTVNIADAVYLLGFLFPGANPPNVLNCADACDANDDGVLNIADVIRLLGSLFGSPTIPLPDPNSVSGCGADPTDTDALDCATNPPGC